MRKHQCGDNGASSPWPTGNQPTPFVARRTTVSNKKKKKEDVDGDDVVKLSPQNDQKPQSSNLALLVLKTEDGRLMLKPVALETSAAVNPESDAKAPSLLKTEDGKVWVPLKTFPVVNKGQNAQTMQPVVLDERVSEAGQLEEEEEEDRRKILETVARDRGYPRKSNVAPALLDAKTGRHGRVKPKPFETAPATLGNTAKVNRASSKRAKSVRPGKKSEDLAKHDGGEEERRTVSETVAKEKENEVAAKPSPHGKRKLSRAAILRAAKTGGGKAPLQTSPIMNRSDVGPTGEDEGEEVNQPEEAAGTVKSGRRSKRIHAEGQKDELRVAERVVSETVAIANEKEGDDAVKPLVHSERKSRRKSPLRIRAEDGEAPLQTPSPHVNRSRGRKSPLLVRIDEGEASLQTPSLITNRSEGRKSSPLRLGTEDGGEAPIQTPSPIISRSDGKKKTPSLFRNKTGDGEAPLQTPSSNISRSGGKKKKKKNRKKSPLQVGTEEGDAPLQTPSAFINRSDGKKKKHLPLRVRTEDGAAPPQTPTPITYRGDGKKNKKKKSPLRVRIEDGEAPPQTPTPITGDAPHPTGEGVESNPVEAAKSRRSKRIKIQKEKEKRAALAKDDDASRPRPQTVGDEVADRPERAKTVVMMEPEQKPLCVPDNPKVKAVQPERRGVVLDAGAERHNQNPNMTPTPSSSLVAVKTGDGGFGPTPLVTNTPEPVGDEEVNQAEARLAHPEDESVGSNKAQPEESGVVSEPIARGDDAKNFLLAIKRKFSAISRLAKIDIGGFKPTAIKTTRVTIRSGVGGEAQAPRASTTGKNPRILGKAQPKKRRLAGLEATVKAGLEVTVKAKGDGYTQTNQKKAKPVDSGDSKFEVASLKTVENESAPPPPGGGEVEVKRPKAETVQSDEEEDFLGGGTFKPTAIETSPVTIKSDGGGEAQPPEANTTRKSGKKKKSILGKAQPKKRRLASLEVTVKAKGDGYTQNNQEKAKPVQTRDSKLKPLKTVQIKNESAPPPPGGGEVEVEVKRPQVETVQSDDEKKEDFLGFDLGITTTQPEERRRTDSNAVAKRKGGARLRHGIRTSNRLKLQKSGKQVPLDAFPARSRNAGGHTLRPARGAVGKVGVKPKKAKAVVRSEKKSERVKSAAQPEERAVSETVAKGVKEDVVKSAGKLILLRANENGIYTLVPFVYFSATEGSDVGDAAKPVGGETDEPLRITPLVNTAPCPGGADAGPPKASELVLLRVDENGGFTPVPFIFSPTLGRSDDANAPPPVRVEVGQMPFKTSGSQIGGAPRPAGGGIKPAPLQFAPGVNIAPPLAWGKFNQPAGSSERNNIMAARAQEERRTVAAESRGNQTSRLVLLHQNAGGLLPPTSFIFSPTMNNITTPKFDPQHASPQRVSVQAERTPLNTTTTIDSTPQPVMGGEVTQPRPESVQPEEKTIASRTSLLKTNDAYSYYEAVASLFRKQIQSISPVGRVPQLVVLGDEVVSQLGAESEQSKGKIVGVGEGVEVQGRERKQIPLTSPVGSTPQLVVLGDDVVNQLGAVSVQSEGKIVGVGEGVAVQGKERKQIPSISPVGRAPQLVILGDEVVNQLGAENVQSEGKIVGVGEGVEVQGKERKQIPLTSPVGRAPQLVVLGDEVVNQLGAESVQSEGKIVGVGEGVEVQGKESTKRIQVLTKEVELKEPSFDDDDRKSEVTLLMKGTDGTLRQVPFSADGHCGGGDNQPKTAKYKLFNPVVKKFSRETPAEQQIVKEPKLPRTFLCHICSETFKTKSEFLKHKHSGAHSCGTCNETYESLLYLQKHEAIHHNNNKDGSTSCCTCDICGRRFNSTYHYEKHVLRHKGEFMHHCPECQKGFCTRDGLVHHFESIHQGIRYQCDICGKVLRSRRYHREHMAQHAEVEVRKNACETCGKVFSTKTCLALHLKIHSGQRYVCDWCGKRSTQLAAHKQHLRVHTGEKPYRCETCGVNFIRYDMLMMHRRRRHDEAKFGCHHCASRFKTKHAYLCHLHTHEEVEKDFPCETCAKRFVDINFLRRHVNRVHVQNLPEEFEKSPPKKRKRLRRRVRSPEIPHVVGDEAHTDETSTKSGKAQERTSIKDKSRSTRVRFLEIPPVVGDEAHTDDSPAKSTISQEQTSIEEEFENAPPKKSKKSRHKSIIQDKSKSTKKWRHKTKTTRVRFHEIPHVVGDEAHTDDTSTKSAIAQEQTSIEDESRSTRVPSPLYFLHVVRNLPEEFENAPPKKSKKSRHKSKSTRLRFPPEFPRTPAKSAITQQQAGIREKAKTKSTRVRSPEFPHHVVGDEPHTDDTPAKSAVAQEQTSVKDKSRSTRVRSPEFPHHVVGDEPHTDETPAKSAVAQEQTSVKDKSRSTRVPSPLDFPQTSIDDQEIFEFQDDIVTSDGMVEVYDNDGGYCNDEDDSNLVPVDYGNGDVGRNISGRES